jgi:hypothetical protein
MQNIADDSEGINQNRTTFAHYVKVKDEIQSIFDIFTMVRIHIAVFRIMTSTVLGGYHPSGQTRCLLLQDTLEAAGCSDEKD